MVIQPSTHAYDIKGNPIPLTTHYIKTTHREAHTHSTLDHDFGIDGYDAVGMLPNRPFMIRYNGGNNTPQDIPVLLLPGICSTQRTMDYSENNDLNSMARWLANRGIDVWSAELENITSQSAKPLMDEIDTWLIPGDVMYKRWLTTHDYTTWATDEWYFKIEMSLKDQSHLINRAKQWTYVSDTLSFEDIPALIAKICNETGRSQIQIIAHSLGGIAVYGLIPTNLYTSGIIAAGTTDLGVNIDMPASPILSAITIAAPGAWITAPPFLVFPHEFNIAESFFKYLAHQGTYFMYSWQGPIKMPITCVGWLDTSMLWHACNAVWEIRMPFFPQHGKAIEYYDTLYAGGSAKLYNDTNSWSILTGHQPSIPIDFMFSGNGDDLIGSEPNIDAVYSLLGGYRNKKPFYHFSDQAHNEMVAGYILEGGDPAWPTTLCSDYGGSYHYLWYHLKKFRDPMPLSATCPTTSLPNNGKALITWSNNKDARSYQIWSKITAGAWTLIKDNINCAKAAEDTPEMSSGNYVIKVRAKGYNNTWKDSDNGSSLGDTTIPLQLITLSVN